jgi:hypothetical protein
MSRFRKESGDFQETRKLSKDSFCDYGTHQPQLRNLAEPATRAWVENKSNKKEAKG